MNVFSIRRCDRRVMWIILLLLAGTCCRTPQHADTPFRLIDSLDADDVIRSPMMNLHTRFPHRSECISPGMVEKIGTIDHGDSLLAFSPSRPVLIDDPSLVPPCIKVYAGGREVPRRDDVQPQAGAWSFLGRNREIRIDLPFFKGSEFETDIILPAGLTKFLLDSSNPQPQDYQPHLSITLDGNHIGRAAVQNDAACEMSVQTELKKYRLAVTCDNIDNPHRFDERGMIIQLLKLRIEASADLILLASSPEERFSDDLDGYTIEYYSLPTDQDPEWDRNPSLPYLKLLFHTARSSPLEDFGVKKLPFPMKTKLRIGEATFNTLLAPTPTEYGQRIRIPPEAKLELGWGVIPVSDSPVKHEVEFILTADDRKQSTLLFQERIKLRPGQKNTPFHRKSLDLDSLSGRTVTFRFITRRVENQSAANIQPAAAFWVNPMLTTPRKKDSEFNAVLISLDTLRADHLGTYGYSRNTSPHIDQLSQDGVQFNRYFSTSSWTLPAHISLFTSMPVALHRIHQNHHRLSPDIITLAEILKTRGYITGAFTGGGYVAPGFGFDRGFDFFQDRGTRGRRSSKRLFEHASEWIRENKEKRFFLFLHTYQIHDPYTPHSPFSEEFLNENHSRAEINIVDCLGGSKGLYMPLPDHRRDNIIALYDGEIRYTDEVLIGPLIRHLKDMDLYDRTLIVLTSDHGEEFHDHGAWLHGHSLYNELIQIPLLVKKPRQEEKGMKRNDPADIMDIPPTLLGLLGIKAKALTKDFRGIDLFESSGRRSKPARAMIAELYRRRSFPSPFPGADKRLQQAAVIDFPFKLNVILDNMLYYYFYSPPPPFKNKVEIELYDLEQDPLETHDIASSHPDVVQRLWKKLERHFLQSDRDSGSHHSFSQDEDLRRQLRALGYIE